MINKEFEKRLKAIEDKIDRLEEYVGFDLTMKIESFESLRKTLAILEENCK